MKKQGGIALYFPNKARGFGPEILLGPCGHPRLILVQPQLNILFGTGGNNLFFAKYLSFSEPGLDRGRQPRQVCFGDNFMFVFYIPIKSLHFPVHRLIELIASNRSEEYYCQKEKTNCSDNYEKNFHYTRPLSSFFILSCSSGPILSYHKVYCNLFLFPFNLFTLFSTPFKCLKFLSEQQIYNSQPVLASKFLHSFFPFLLLHLCIGP